MVATIMKFRHGTEGDAPDTHAGTGEAVARHTVDSQAPDTATHTDPGTDQGSRPVGLYARLRAWKIPN